MKTPFDAARRAADRELDRVRAEIGQATVLFARVRENEERLAREIARERAQAGGGAEAERWFRAAHARRAALAAELLAAAQRLEALRVEAAKCFGRQAAVAGAADAFRADAERAAAAAEQVMLDDLGAARLTARAARRRAT